MARSSSEDTTTESYLMSDGLERDSASRGSSRPRSDAYDEDDYYFDYNHPRSTQRSMTFTRFLDLVGIHGRRRRRDYDFHTSSSGEALRGLLARPPGRRRAARESRSCRKGLAVSTVRKVLIFTPFVLLMLFGVLHVIESVLGSAQLLWDYDDDEVFLPDWGRPGSIGDGLSEYPTNATRDVLPIACHSHNDYWRRVPLFEAIHWGCTSIEADVWLFDEDLFVGHSVQSLSRGRTFRSLYVDPLVDLLDKMNTPGEFSNASQLGVFDEVPEQQLILLVDIKSDPYSTYRLLEDQLEPLRAKDYLTYHDGKQLIQRAITVVGSGDTPFDLVRAASKRREIFFDAPLDILWEVPASPVVPSSDSDSKIDYATAMMRAPANHTASILLRDPAIDTDSSLSPDDYDASNSYYASTSFSKSVGFIWRGQLSARQYEIVRGQIRGAKRRGLKVRYWDTPAWPVSARNYVWQVLMEEGADILNVDDLKGAATEDWRRRVHRWWS